MSLFVLSIPCSSAEQYGALQSFLSQVQKDFGVGTVAEALLSLKATYIPRTIPAVNILLCFIYDMFNEAVGVVLLDLVIFFRFSLYPSADLPASVFPLCPFFSPMLHYFIIL